MTRRTTGRPTFDQLRRVVRRDRYRLDAFGWWVDAFGIRWSGSVGPAAAVVRAMVPAGSWTADQPGRCFRAWCLGHVRVRFLISVGPPLAKSMVWSSSAITLRQP